MVQEYWTQEAIKYVSHLIGHNFSYECAMNKLIYQLYTNFEPILLMLENGQTMNNSPWSSAIFYQNML